MSKIEIYPKICGGKPHIKGTRILVKNILGMFAGGYSTDTILKEYPELKAEDISEALNYASEIIDEDKVILKEAL